MRVCRVAEMRDLDRRATADYGIPEMLLMENAGAAAFDVLRRHFSLAGGPVVVVCGGGNNGGDGLVVARRLHAAGTAVTVFLLADPARYGGSARLNFDILSRLPVPCSRLEDVGPLRLALVSASAVVDGILGTGVDRPVGGLYRDAIVSINASGVPVLGLDVPSGVNGDTGAVLGVAVHAAATVTFGLPKIGNLLPPGSDHGGRLFVSDISFPPALQDDPALPFALVEPAHIESALARASDSSGGCGGFLVRANGPLSAQSGEEPSWAMAAFLAAGGRCARLVAATRANRPIADDDARQDGEACPGVLVAVVDARQDGEVRPGVLVVDDDGWQDGEGRPAVLVVDGDAAGAPDMQRRLSDILGRFDGPMALDGIVARDLAACLPAIWRHSRPVCWVHDPSDPVDAGLVAEPSPIDAALAFAHRIGGVVAWLGARSVVARPDGGVWIGPPRSAATDAGSALLGPTADGPDAARADIVLGIAAALLARGLPADDAAVVAVFAHRLATELAFGAADLRAQGAGAEAHGAGVGPRGAGFGPRGAGVGPWGAGAEPWGAGAAPRGTRVGPRGPEVASGALFARAVLGQLPLALSLARDGLPDHLAHLYGLPRRV